jgi:hypothetical protein
MTEAPRLPRRGRSLAAAITALLLGAAAVTVAIDVISIQTRHAALIYPYRQIAGQLRAARWDDTGVMAIAATIALVGLVLLCDAVIPGQPKVIQVAGPSPEVAVGTSRRSLRRAVRSAALRVDGIAAASVRLRRRSLVVLASTRLRDRGDMDREVTAVVSELLDQLGPRRPFRISVRLRTMG